MDKSIIIAQVESLIPENVLQGNYTPTGLNMPLKQFLETVLINNIRDDATVDMVYNYVKEKILPDVHPFVFQKDITEPYVEIPQNISSPNEHHNLIHINGEMVLKIEPSLARAYIQNFIDNHANFVPYVKTSESSVVDTKDYLFSKIPFMDTHYMIQIGETKKTLEEVYNILLKNTYHSPSLAEKAELCIYFAEQLDEKVLMSTIDDVNMTVEDYITEYLPTIMVNATDVAIQGNLISVNVVIEMIAKKQLEKLQEEKRLEEFNRTGENPNLLSEIKYALDPEEGIEITAEIPVVSSYQVSEDEVNALSSLSRDDIYDNDALYFASCLNNLKHSIYFTNNAQDLSNKEREFKYLSKEILNKVSDLQIRKLIDSTEDLINSKRNEIIKIENNRNEYSEALLGEMAVLSQEIDSLDSIDAYGTITYYIYKLEEEIKSKGIKDIAPTQALEHLKRKLQSQNIKFIMLLNDRKKNDVISSINDKISYIRSKTTNIYYFNQNAFNEIDNEIDSSIEDIKDEINDAISNGLLSEREIEKFNKELDMINNKLKNIKNVVGFR